MAKERGAGMKAEVSKYWDGYFILTFTNTPSPDISRITIDEDSREKLAKLRQVFGDEFTRDAIYHWCVSISYKEREIVAFYDPKIDKLMADEADRLPTILEDENAMTAVTSAVAAMADFLKRNPWESRERNRD